MRTIACALLLISAAIAYAPPPTLEDFTQPERFTQAKISPTGEYVAASLINRDTADGSFRVIRRENSETIISFGMGDRKRVHDFWWIQDHRVMVAPTQRKVGTEKYDRNYRLMTINTKSKDTRDLEGANVVNVWNLDDRFVVVQKLEGRYLELHKMNDRSGRTIKLARAAVPFSLQSLAIPGDKLPAWVQNREGEVWFSSGMGEELVNESHYRPGKGEWQLTSSIPWGEKGWFPVAWGLRPGTFLTFNDRRASNRGVGVYDPKTNEHKLLLRHL